MFILLSLDKNFEVAKKYAKSEKLTVPIYYPAKNFWHYLMSTEYLPPLSSMKTVIWLSKITVRRTTIQKNTNISYSASRHVERIGCKRLSSREFLQIKRAHWGCHLWFKMGYDHSFPCPLIAQMEPVFSVRVFC